ncbi:LivK ABC-type branched-chain amino acid transport systems, periplasmic component [Acidimicrobiia bacterium]|jgi:branched-chain amino acid transport system substrate-binding protein
MNWLTSLPTLALLLIVMSVIGAISASLYLLIDRKIGGHREHAGMAAAAYMTALGSLFAILTGFLINSEYSTLREARQIVGTEAAASSRLASATEGLPSVDASALQVRLGQYLRDASTSDWKALADGDAQDSPAFLSLRELQATVFSISSRPYAPAATVDAMDNAIAELTSSRRELISLANSEMPFQLFALSAIAGLALIINAMFVALRTGGSTAYVAVGIIVIVALDLALILGISAPFRGPFIVDKEPIQTMSEEVLQGVYLPWVGPGSTIATDAGTCDADPRGCLTIEAGDSIQLGALLRVGADSMGIGRDSRRGIELAIDYLDAEFDGAPGMLLGHSVSVVAADDQCSAAGGREGAERILLGSRLAAVIGTSCSGAALDAAEPIFSRAGIPLMSAQNTAPGLTSIVKPGSTYARTAPNDLIQGSVVADFVVNGLLAKTVVVISDGTVYSEQLGQTFVARLGSIGATALPTVIAPKGSDFSAVARSLVNAGADAVYMPVNSPVCEDLMDAIADTPGGGKMAVVTSDACANSDVVPAATRVSAYASGPDIAALSRKPFYSEQYEKAYISTFGGQPLSVWNTSAFDATNLLFDSIQRIAVLGADGSISIPRSALVEAIRVINGYRGVSNQMVCKPTGDCAQSATIAVYKAPFWPVGPNAANSTPVFSKTETLAAVVARN